MRQQSVSECGCRTGIKDNYWSVPDCMTQLPRHIFHDGAPQSACSLIPCTAAACSRWRPWASAWFQIPPDRPHRQADFQGFRGIIQSCRFSIQKSGARLSQSYACRAIRPLVLLVGIKRKAAGQPAVVYSSEGFLSHRNTVCNSVYSEPATIMFLYRLTGSAPGAGFILNSSADVLSRNTCLRQSPAHVW